MSPVSDVGLRLPRYFVAVADERNFTRAAERVEPSTPSVPAPRGTKLSQPGVGLSFILGTRIADIPYVVTQWRREHPGERMPDSSC
jgi:hypothetical protein